MALTATASLPVTAHDAAAAPKTYVVTIEGMQFNPPTLTVQRGDRVVWANKDLIPHTASANARLFDSHSIAANASWTYLPDKSGSYPYGCSFHPTMRAVLIVR
ncbi:cupredoxin domain-containing protein [Paraburkholderia fungorum]|uniref:cupredoxin domain-containing protein n=1 Tax=Paraburkholderia fungorum TaxID=134537 RepID=UPI0038BBEF0B